MRGMMGISAMLKRIATLLDLMKRNKATHQIRERSGNAAEEVLIFPVMPFSASQLTNMV